MNKILITFVLMTFVFVTSVQAQQKSPPSSEHKASVTAQKVMDQNLKDKIKNTKGESSTENPKITDGLLNIDAVISDNSQNNENTIAIEGESNNNNGSGIGTIIKPVTAIISDVGSSFYTGSEIKITKGDVEGNDDNQGIQDTEDVVDMEQEAVIKDIKPITAIIIQPDAMEQGAVIKDIKPITDIIIHFHSGSGEQDTNHQNYLDGESSDEAEEESAARFIIESEVDNSQTTDVPTQQQEEDSENLSTSLNSLDLLGRSSIEINAYPNPTTDFFTLEFSKTADYDIYISNVLGQVKQVFQTGETNSYQVDVANWIPGDYIVQIVKGNEIITKRIIVTH